MMTVSRKAAKKKHANKTRHMRVMAGSKVKELVKTLRRRWSAMRNVDRGERLCELVSLGCSRRGLGRELKQSATSIRRHIQIARLPEEDLKAMETGTTAKEILKRKACADRHKRRQQRVDEDRRTGALSDDVATTILEFCRLGKELRKESILEGDVETLLDAAALHLSRLEASGHRSRLISKKLGLKAQFQRMRPPKAQDTFWIAFQGEWLANVVWANAAEGPIRDRALQKAMARANEIRPKKTPSEIYRDRKRQLAEISASPVRPFYPGGAAGSMKRQGRPTERSKPE